MCIDCWFRPLETQAFGLNHEKSMHGSLTCASISRSGHPHMHRYLGPATPMCIDFWVRPPPCASRFGHPLVHRFLGLATPMCIDLWAGHLQVHRFLGPPTAWCIDFSVRPPSCASISRSGHPHVHRFLGALDWAPPCASISGYPHVHSQSGHPHVHRFLSPGTPMCIDFSVRPYLCTWQFICRSCVLLARMTLLALGTSSPQAICKILNCCLA